MRIIRGVVALLMLIFNLAPQITFAATANKVSSNETKINFNIHDHIHFKDGIAMNMKKGSPYRFSGTAQNKSEEQKKREAMLAKYEEKRKNANYPEGEFTINASAYTAAADECGKSDGITASGVKVKENETIACPPQYPFGTKIKIYGKGTYVCEDRGGAIKGNHVDIYVETKQEAFAFGRQNLKAEVVEES
jgi:3D (Asp-Asp-Asp) domain-containing protein